MRPSLSLIVPTAELKKVEIHLESGRAMVRPSLEICLASVVYQLSDDDEVIVVGDCVDGPLRETEKIVESFGPRVKYLEGPETEHSFGHREVNFGIAHASGDWINVNDDDDMWVPGAVDVMRSTAAVAGDRPVLFRFLSYHGIIFWLDRLHFQQDCVGGHCLLCRNIPGKLGKWADHYQGDWSFVEETVNLQGGPANIIWKEDIIVVARPSETIMLSVLEAAGRLVDESS